MADAQTVYNELDQYIVSSCKADARMLQSIIKTYHLDAHNALILSELIQNDGQYNISDPLIVSNNLNARSDNVLKNRNKNKEENKEEEYMWHWKLAELSFIKNPSDEPLSVRRREICKMLNENMNLDNISTARLHKILEGLADIEIKSGNIEKNNPDVPDAPDVSDAPPTYNVAAPAAPAASNPNVLETQPQQVYGTADHAEGQPIAARVSSTAAASGLCDQHGRPINPTTTVQMQPVVQQQMRPQQGDPVGGNDGQNQGPDDPTCLYILACFGFFVPIVGWIAMCALNCGSGLPPRQKRAFNVLGASSCLGFLFWAFYSEIEGNEG